MRTLSTGFTSPCRDKPHPANGTTMISTCFRTAKLSATSSRHGDDLRRDPLEGRKATLEMILGKAGGGIRFNEHMDGDGENVFRHAYKLELEGIVSKRKDSAYRSGRSPDWLKMKSVDAPAVKREEQGEWGRDKWRSKVSGRHSF
jgi:ATP dependent DNA ligase domain